jgi:putative Mg2+ transporter-C (MgtC) family protein
MHIEAVHPEFWTVVVRLAVATFLGLLIGLERELDGHDAGARTHALLALGAAVFGAISIGAFADFAVASSETNVRVDVTRVASYVAAGIGFIGAGAIVRYEVGVKGLTTAASLWVAAGVGLAAGLGFWAGAIAGAVLTLLTLLAERPMRWLRTRAGNLDPEGDR